MSTPIFLDTSFAIALASKSDEHHKLQQNGKGDHGRIHKLLSRKIVTQDQYQALLDVHKTRRRYFHWWKTSLNNVQPDACKSVNALSRLTKALLLELKDSQNGPKLWVSASIRKFFESKAKPLVQG